MSRKKISKKETQDIKSQYAVVEVTPGFSNGIFGIVKEVIEEDSNPVRDLKQFENFMVSELPRRRTPRPLNLHNISQQMEVTFQVDHNELDNLLSKFVINGELKLEEMDKIEEDPNEEYDLDLLDEIDNKLEEIFKCHK